MNNIQFAHANGFPAKTYSHLFSLLDPGKINYVERMGHGDFKLDGTLDQLVDEVIQSIESNFQEPVLGLGHSTGGTLILLAAIKRPELFNNLILIEPVLFCLRKRLIFWFLKQFSLLDKLGPSKTAMRRRTFFKNKELAKNNFLSKQFFRHFNPKCLDDYLNHGWQESADKSGIELSFSAKIEAEIFRTVLSFLPREAKKKKGTLLYGNSSDMFNSCDINWWRRNMVGFDVISTQGGHMFPLERPQEAANIINNLLG